MKETTLSSTHVRKTDLMSTTSAETSAQLIEVLTGILILYVLYQYAQLRTARSTEERQYHRTRLLQTTIAFGGLVYLGSIITPTLETWPIHLGIAVQDAVQTTAAEMTHLLQGTGFRARIHQVGLTTYLFIVILIALGVRVPIILWNAIFGR